MGGGVGGGAAPWEERGGGEGGPAWGEMEIDERLLAGNEIL